MAAPNTISIDQLSRLIGTPACPTILDVRLDEDFDLDPRHIPTARRIDHRQATSRDGPAGLTPGERVVVVCHKGLKLSHGVAAFLRHGGWRADVLEGGFTAWANARQPLVPDAAIPARDVSGRTVWVTRARPKVDRIACPWLIRRFIDPAAVFLFVAPSEVSAVAERFGATPFDVEGVPFAHHADQCSFDALIAEFDLATRPLTRLAALVRGADTAQPELAAEAAGLLAASLGLSRMFSDDLEQLNAGMILYDALYRWCRDATAETHDRLNHRGMVA
ncbi:MAG: chromate resistance protein ChrB domain-containing protein [Pseudomonadota bacterium]